VRDDLRGSKWDEGVIEEKKKKDIEKTWKIE